MTRSREAFISLLKNIASDDECRELRDAATNDMERVFYSHQGLAADKWHHYLAIYERYLNRYRDTHARLLEIGVQDGGSLQIWREYLGVHARVQGLDIEPRCASLPVDAEVTIGDQVDPATLDAIAAGATPLNIVIDDGGHRWRDQIKTFAILFPQMADDGVYICEDVHTSYVDQFGDDDGPTFIDYARSLVDRIHAPYQGRLETPVSRLIQGIHIYDSVVVIEKGPRKTPRRVIRGTERPITFQLTDPE